MNNEEIIKDKKVLAALEAEYKHVRCLVDSIRTTVTDLNFEELMPDSQERCLMVDQLQAYDYLRTNLMNRIRFYRNRIKANKPEPWEEHDNDIKDWSQYKKTDRYKISVDVSSEGDHSGCCQVCGDNITDQHHCGLDSVNNEEELQSLEELLGMEVVAICGSKTKCVGCPQETDSCVKVELKGGDYICLANPQQDFTDCRERHTISFDEEEGSVMDDIKEKTEAFMDYLDSVVKD